MNHNKNIIKKRKLTPRVWLSVVIVISCFLEFILDSKSRLMGRFAVNYYVGLVQARL